MRHTLRCFKRSVPFLQRLFVLALSQNPALRPNVYISTTTMPLSKRLRIVAKQYSDKVTYLSTTSLTPLSSIVSFAFTILNYLHFPDGQHRSGGVSMNGGF